MTREEFYEQYSNYIVSMAKAMETNDYKLNNKIALKLNKLIKKNPQFFDKKFIIMINHENLEISLNACVDSLRHNILVEDAISKLELIKEKNQNLLSFRADMCLKIYRGEVAGKKL